MTTLSDAPARCKLANTSNDQPLSIRQIAEWMLEKIGNKTFVAVKGVVHLVCDGKVQPLASAAELFAAIDHYADVAWSRSPSARTKEEFFRGLPRYLEQYDWVSEHPHFPRIKGVLYTRKAPKASQTGMLAKLIGHFSPAGPIDRRLLEALACTFYWGGPCGRRPMFAITGEGRGSGKSTVVDVLSSLVGGVVSIGSESLQDASQITTRLLSGDGRTKMVCNLDNLKTHRFSSSTVEGLVTAQDISGRQLFVGNGTRPNYVTWCTTVNGASFSEDFAQRNVVIKLKKPTYAGNWEATVGAFIETNREAIEADVRHTLEVAKPKPVAAFTRRGVWEQQVLAKFKNPNKTIAELLSRGQAINADAYDRDDLLDFLRGKLRQMGVGKPDAAWGLIGTSLLTAWLKEYDDAIHRKTVHGFVSRHLEGVLFFKRVASSRHWVWKGAKVNKTQEKPGFSLA
jgi:hypothetical protein